MIGYSYTISLDIHRKREVGTVGARGPAKGTKLVPMTEARVDKFLTVLRSTGSWGAACEATAPKGSGPRKCYSSWRKLRLTSRQFAEDCADIQEANAESLIRSLIERGRDGIDVEIFYAGKQVFNSDGTPKTIKKYSDPLLLAALKAAFPERFGDSKRVDIHHHKADSHWNISADDLKYLSEDQKVNLSDILETVSAGVDAKALTHQPGETLEGVASAPDAPVAQVVEAVAVEVVNEVAEEVAETFPPWVED